MNDPSGESSQHVPRSLLVELEQAIAASHAQDNHREDARIGGLEDVRGVAERLVGSAGIGAKGGTQVRRARDEQFLAAGALTDAEFAELHPGERFVGSPPGYAVGGMVHSELKGCACAKCVSRWREGLAAPHSSAAAQTANDAGQEAIARPAPAQLAEAPVPGLYRHRKGRAYRVHGVAAESTNARSGRKVVVYEDGRGLFTRDLDEWNRPVDGEPRFRLVEATPEGDMLPALIDTCALPPERLAALKTWWDGKPRRGELRIVVGVDDLTPHLERFVAERIARLTSSHESVCRAHENLVIKLGRLHAIDHPRGFTPAYVGALDEVREAAELLDKALS
jgi:hypothetical protein